MPQYSERKITPEDSDKEREKDKIIEMEDLQTRHYREQTEQVSQEISAALGEIEQATFYSESLDQVLRESYIPSIHPAGENQRIIDNTEMIRQILENDDEPDAPNHQRNQRSNTKNILQPRSLLP